MVGGAYISGTASEIATKGLVNTIAPIGYNIGLAIGNKVFICISYSTPCLVNARLLHELLFFTMLYFYQTQCILILQIKTNFHTLSNCKYLSFSYALIYVHI